jgi:hypothetical protein
MMTPGVERQTSRGLWHAISQRSGVSWRTIWSAILFIFLMCVPAIFNNPYYLRFIQIAAIFGIAALALSLVFGKGGIVSIGHMGLFGLGAYTSAVLALKFGWPVWIAMITAVIVSGFGGWLLALSSARLDGRLPGHDDGGIQYRDCATDYSVSGPDRCCRRHDRHSAAQPFRARV